MIDWDSLVIGPLVGVFGEPVTYTPANHAPIQITGVFDREYEGVAPLGISMGQIGSSDTGDTDQRPVLGVQLSQFPSGVVLNQDDELTITNTGVTYRVKEVREDGHGAAKLLLNEA